MDRYYPKIEKIYVRRNSGGFTRLYGPEYIFSTSPSFTHENMFCTGLQKLGIDVPDGKVIEIEMNIRMIEICEKCGRPL